MCDASITRCGHWPGNEIVELLAESEAAGFLFVRRLVTEWASGVNRFAEAGELLLAARSDGRLIGICGLNRDPYAASERVGRVRHLYVMAAFRRQGIGRRLLDEIIAAARGTYDRLHLRTDSQEAARFYEGLGFQECSDMPDCTHCLELAPGDGSGARSFRGGYFKDSRVQMPPRW